MLTPWVTRASALAVRSSRYVSSVLNRTRPTSSLVKGAPTQLSSPQQLSIRYFSSNPKKPGTLLTDEFLHRREDVSATLPGTKKEIFHKTTDTRSSIHGETFTWKQKEATTVHDHGTTRRVEHTTQIDKPVETLDDEALSKLFSKTEDAENLKFYRTLKAEGDKLPVTRYTAEQIEQATKSFYGKGSPRKERVLHLVIGPPGSGKSSVVVDPLAEKYGAMIVDSDHIKPHIPGYNKGIGGNAVHEVSANIASQILVKAMASGDNIVHPTTGYCPEYIMELVNTAKAKGYKVGVHLVDLPKEEAAKRVLNRAVIEINGVRQVVNLTYALKVVGDKPKAAFEKVIAQHRGLIDEYSHWNNNVARGQKPILVEQSEHTIEDLLKAAKNPTNE
jgi:predicted kinase